jgi:hypothetical protein
MGRQAYKFAIYILALGAVYFTAHAYYFPFSFNAGRTMGMAGAFTAVDAFEYSVEYNPAALAWPATPPLKFYMAKYKYYLPPAEGEEISTAIATEKTASFGLGLGPGLEYAAAEGKKNMWPYLLGYYSGEDMPLFPYPASPVMGYACHFGRLSLGINAHVYSPYSPVMKGDAWRNIEISYADIGAIYRLNGVFSFGASLQRYSWQMFKSVQVHDFGYGFIISKYEEPARLNLGISCRPGPADLFALDLWNAASIKVSGWPGNLPEPFVPVISLHAGFEHCFNKWLVCRLGALRPAFVDFVIRQHVI